MTATRLTLLASALERIIAQALRYDPGTRGQLHTLANRTLAVTSTAPETTLFFTLSDDAIRVTTVHEGKPDCRLTGSLVNLGALALRPDSKTLANTDVYIEGNPGVLNQYLELLRDLDIDWEDALANVVGSVPAHTLAVAIRRQHQWLDARGRQLPGYLSELITEEFRLTPGRIEADLFYQDVSDLRSDVARLEARLEHLQRQLPTKL